MMRVFTACAALASASAASAQIVFHVPATANPWLAGSPSGTTAGGGGDIAPAQSPVLAAGITVTPGQSLQFINVTGQASNDPNEALVGADGGMFFLTKNAPENGMGSTRAPRSALVAVFVGAGIPVSGPNPGDIGNMFTDYEYGSPGPSALTASSYAPALQSVFFVGDGLTGNGSGSVQSFVVPAGATRLYIGVMDSFQWANNVGGYSVTVVPAPASIALLGLGGLVTWRRRR